MNLDIGQLTMEKKIIVALMCFSYNISITLGQHFNMTGSSRFAMFTPPGQTARAVVFHRNNLLCANILYIRGNCIVDIADYKYRYGCSSISLYTLTIPAQNMTEYEEESAWSCEHYLNSSYRSPEVILNIASKPKPDAMSITLGVTDITGIDFSVTVIAYPEPQFELIHENETNNMKNSITRNDVYNFTIRYKKIIVRQDDYGTFHLIVSNPFGVATIFIQVIPQRRPDIPRSVTLTCEGTSSILKWISSFNGGERQTFIVVTFNVQYGTIYSERIPDKGENTVHSYFIDNLQPSTLYLFYVSAENRHGKSSSENKSCTTRKQDTGSLQTAVIAGSGGGTLTVIVIVLIAVFLVYRRYTCICVLQKRNENKANTIKEDTSYYTTIAEQENRERNVYESLQRPNANSSEEQDIHKSQKREFKTKGNIYPTTQVSKDSTVKPTEVYVNTSFM